MAGAFTTLTTWEAMNESTYILTIYIAHLIETGGAASWNPQKAGL